MRVEGIEVGGSIFKRNLVTVESHEGRIKGGRGRGRGRV